MFPIQITGRHLSLTDALENSIYDKAGKLAELNYPVVHCHVVLDRTTAHHRKGHVYSVQLDLGLADKAIVVHRNSVEDLYLGIKQVFDTARRELRDYFNWRYITRYKGKERLSESKQESEWDQAS